MSYALNTDSTSAIRPTLPICAVARPTTDAKEVSHESRRLTHDMHGRARRIDDRHRHFLDLQAVGLGDSEDLHVERESIDLRTFEDEPTGVGAERFEPALGVAVVAEQHGVRQPVDDAPAHLAQPSG